VLRTVRQQAESLPSSAILFLGDNVYPDGVPDPRWADTADAQRRLDSQIGAIPPGVRGIFVPGNHDWMDGGLFVEVAAGLDAIRRQNAHIARRAAERELDVRLLPANGCPGPVVEYVGRVRLVLLDTQWWLHEAIVGDSSAGCRPHSIDGVIAELRSLMQAHPAGSDTITIVAAHHPLLTGGEHGAYCGILAPLRSFAFHRQDTFSSANRGMREAIIGALRLGSPLIYAAGHEHNLQVLRGDGYGAQYLLVSGVGSPGKPGCAVRLRESLYVAQNLEGFMRLDVHATGVLLRVFTNEGGPESQYTRWLAPQR
jgi:hypothetical protein